MDMYFDYAPTVLDTENLGKLTVFVDNVFAMGSSQLIYFYDAEGASATRLVRMMMDNYPTIFGRPGSNSRVKIYDGRDPSDSVPKAPAIVIVNSLPDGIHTSKIIVF